MINVYVEKKYIFLVHTQADFPMYGPVYTLINFELRLMGSRKKKWSTLLLSYKEDSWKNLKKTMQR